MKKFTIPDSLEVATYCIKSIFILLSTLQLSEVRSKTVVIINFISMPSGFQ